jgi:DNA-binding transcriptional ArsR family regulator
MAEPVLVLEPGDERAQKIAKAMSGQTAGEILRLLGENQKSLTDLADRLALPMNSVKYHVENLLDAGLISVADTRYSVKGREVKIYSLTDQLLIVAPRQSDVRSLLLKYGSLFGIVAVASLAVAVIGPLLAENANAPAVVAPAAFGVVREAPSVALKANVEGMAAPAAATIDPALAFFLGGVLVVLVLLCYEAWLWKRRG